MTGPEHDNADERDPRDQSDPRDPSDGHGEFDELAAAGALHALEPADERRFAEHAAGCDICGPLAGDFAATAAALGEAVEDFEPPERLRAAIVAAARAEGPPAAPAPRSHPGRSRPAHAPSRRARGAPRGRALAGLVAGLVALALAAGFAVWGTVQADRADDRLATLRSRDAVLAQLGRPGTRSYALPATAGAGGEVVVTPTTTYLVTTGLPANDAGRDTYVLWAITAAGKPAGLAAFDVAGRPVTVVDAGRLPPAAAAPKAFAISIEPGRAVPAAPTKVVIG